MERCIGLIDCNNFFASCERIFRPDLKHRPIIVLSNNDGCIIARSAEAKQLNIKMGMPYFKIRDFLEQNGVEVFSSNYALYGDISNRVMKMIESLVPRMEVYSIDESFVDLSGLCATERYKLAQHIKQKVKQDIGIDICIGYSNTKTLAKLANYAAKKYQKTGGIVDLLDVERQARLLKIIPVEEVWGVGRRLSKQLNLQGIRTAYDLRMSDAKSMSRIYSVVLEKTIKELSGIKCEYLSQNEAARQQMIYSRGFGRIVENHEEMKQVVATYAENVAKKLREHKLFVRNITVFTQENRFINPSSYHKDAGYVLNYATNDTSEIVGSALACLESIWKPNKKYVKAGVILRNLDEGDKQPDLFKQSQSAESLKLMSVIDQINHRFGNNVYLATQGGKKEWDMRRGKLSPSYTTRWQDIPKVS